MLLEGLVPEYLVHLDVEKGYSPHTLRCYGSDLDLFIAHLDREGIVTEVENIQAAHIRSFVARLRMEGRKPATIARKFNAIRSFWNYLLDCEYTERNPCRKISTPKLDQRLRELDDDRRHVERLVGCDDGR